MFHLVSTVKDTRSFTGNIGVDIAMKYKPLQEMTSSQNKEQLSPEVVKSKLQSKVTYNLMVDVNSASLADISLEVSKHEEGQEGIVPS